MTNCGGIFISFDFLIHIAIPNNIFFIKDSMACLSNQSYSSAIVKDMSESESIILFKEIFFFLFLRQFNFNIPWYILNPLNKEGVRYKSIVHK